MTQFNFSYIYITIELCQGLQYEITMNGKLKECSIYITQISHGVLSSHFIIRHLIPFVKWKHNKLGESIETSKVNGNY